MDYKAYELNLLSKKAGEITNDYTNRTRYHSLNRKHEWMMNVLQMAKSLELPDWWICAGFVRSKIWDTLHDYEAKTAMPDVDVIYYDSLHQDEIYEQSLETKLMNIDATIPWSVKIKLVCM